MKAIVKDIHFMRFKKTQLYNYKQYECGWAGGQLSFLLCCFCLHYPDPDIG